MGNEYWAAGEGGGKVSYFLFVGLICLIVVILEVI
jgi:hypothetical protein